MKLQLLSSILNRNIYFLDDIMNEKFILDKCNVRIELQYLPQFTVPSTYKFCQRAAEAYAAEQYVKCPILFTPCVTYFI